MTFTTEDRSFITRTVALTGIGTVVVLGGLGLILATTARQPKAEKLLAAGDTPVVLVGGTLTFNAGDNTYPWTPVSGPPFQMTPNYAIKAIVVKQDKSSSGDNGADKLRVDVSNAASWEVDEYISVAGADERVASITGVATPPNTASPIYLNLVTGYLCPGSAPITVITYGIAAGCPAPPAAPAPDPIKFSKVSITVNGQPQPTATLACYDASDPQGQCRIVFRGH
jgi:hypothetical protein